MKIFSGNVMVGADLGAAQAAKEAFGLVGARTVARIRFFVVDALYGECSRQPVPVGRLIGVNRSATLDAGMNDGDAFGLALPDARNSAPAALTDGDNDLTLAGLVQPLAAVLAVCAFVRRLHVAAEIRAINFHVALERTSLTRGLYGLAHFV